MKPRIQWRRFDGVWTVFMYRAGILRSIVSVPEWMLDKTSAEEILPVWQAIECASLSLIAGGCHAPVLVEAR